MNEEQFADLLTEHLDTFLAGAPLPETGSDEVAELLAVAQSLSEIAPRPRPEFGPALKESLLRPTNGGNGAAPTTASTFGRPTFFILLIGVLGIAIGLALLASPGTFVITRPTPLESPSPAALPDSIQIFTAPTPTRPAGSPLPTAPPIQTQTVLIQNPPVIQTPSSSTPATPAITPTLSVEPVISPTLTTTPIIDILPVVITTIEIRVDPPDLLPGPGGGGGGSGGGGGGGSSGSGGSGSGGDSGGSSGGGSGGDDNDDDGGDVDD